jgi:hypothetical protein
MTQARRPRANPFYVLLMAVSTLFVVTTLGYLVGPYAAQRVAEGKAAPSPLADWFERKGVVALAIEFGLMAALALLAMATDHLFDGRKTAPKGPDRPEA